MYGIYANIGGILMGSMLPYIAYMDPMGYTTLSQTHHQISGQHREVSPPFELSFGHKFPSVTCLGSRHCDWKFDWRHMAGIAAIAASSMAEVQDDDLS